MIDPSEYLERFEGSVNWSAKGLEVLYNLDCEIELRKMVGGLLSDRGFTIERLWWEYSLKGRVFINLDQEGIHTNYHCKGNGWVRSATICWGDEELHYLWDYIRDLWRKSLAGG